MSVDTTSNPIATAVQQRAAELLVGTETKIPLDPAFVRQCLDANERGDGCLFASIHRGNYLYNTTPKDGEWYAWAGHVWERDEFRHALAAVEDCALEYQAQAEQLQQQIRDEGIVPKGPGTWKIQLKEKFQARTDRLRSAVGASKVLHWAPVVEMSMACREHDFDKEPWLLPVANGVVDLRTGALTTGRPEDLLTRALDIDYDPHADYAPWQQFIDEVSGDPDEIAPFIKRSLGYSITGHSYEQYIWMFVGPGRNGKGVMFDLIGDIMGPYYHEISRAMLVEQRNEPSPSATSEHKYSLLRKRIVVGAETNKGQRIDAAAIKELTGEDLVKCRPLFKSEIQFKPTHTLFLHTNHPPVGLTKDFAMVQRFIRVEFPFMYVDDVEAEKKKYPARAAMFRQKDPTLKDKLRKIKPGILRWLVEGAREWAKNGLNPPASIIKGVNDLAWEEDSIGQFMADCLIADPGENRRLACTDMYNGFKWWWSQNMDSGERRIPAMKTINAAIRERGHTVEKSGGKTWIYNHAINPELEMDIAEYTRKTAKS